MAQASNYHLNTVPFALILLITLVTLFVISIVTFVIYQYELFVFIICVLILGGFLIGMLISNPVNIITITDKFVKYKDKCYSWDDVRISMYFPINFFSGKAYYFVFSSHFYEMTENKDYKKDRFCLLLTMKRAKMILSKYNQKVSIIEEGSYAQNILKMVKEHNKRIC